MKLNIWHGLCAVSTDVVALSFNCKGSGHPCAPGERPNPMHATTCFAKHNCTDTFVGYDYCTREVQMRRLKEWVMQPGGGWMEVAEGFVVA